MSGKKEKLTQLNARIPVETRQVIKAVAAITGFKMEDIAVDAIAWYYGHSTKMIEARRAMCVEAFKRVVGKGPIPFESLLAPGNNNALTGGAEAVNLVASTPGGAVAQLAEHHNGIEPPNVKFPAPKQSGMLYAVTLGTDGAVGFLGNTASTLVPPCGGPKRIRRSA